MPIPAVAMTDIQSLDLDMEMQCINNIRYVSAALPTIAKSGHPGAPIGIAPVSHCIWAHMMKYDPEDPGYALRDRFVLSAGHASALQYTQMHLATSYITMDDLKEFRKLGSRTPGHPECHVTPGVEVTTGPLGLGIAQAVGLAIGQHYYNAKFGPYFDCYTYCIVGDGCLQEGASAEACSLAGTLGLGRLICVYDSNKITIDGSTDMSFTEDVAKRFESYGFEIFTVKDGDNDIVGILSALQAAKKNLDAPSLIIVQTTIGYRATLQGTAKVHGSPLSEEELLRIRKDLNMEGDILTIDQKVYDYYAKLKEKKLSEVLTRWESYREEIPQDVRYNTHYRSICSPEKITNFINSCPQFNNESKPNSTRNLSGEILNVAATCFEALIGGSADLTGSNMTALKGEGDFSRDNKANRYLRFGVRELAMQAITNGLRAHGGFIPFCSTFLNFVSFSFPALRLAALSNLPTLFIATHDSIELGEDGPTHQAVEVIPLLRATPNLQCWRPCDGKEVVGMYASYLQSLSQPVVGCLSRGNCPHYNETDIQKSMKHGAYILRRENYDSSKKNITIAASGTEVRVAMEAADKLKDSGYGVSVVSMPCFDIFNEQPCEYQDSIFPKSDLCVVVEACNINGLERFVNAEASTYMNTFGASAPSSVLMDHFGFTADKVSAKVVNCMKERCSA